jgi:hypothetical protein
MRAYKIFKIGVGVFIIVVLVLTFITLAIGI